MSTFYEKLVALGGAYGAEAKPMGGKDPSNLMVAFRCLAAGDLQTVNRDYLYAISEGDIPDHSSLLVNAFYKPSDTAQLFSKEVYTEQATGAQRSIVSTSANDAAAGTGARVVRIDGVKGDDTFFTDEVTLAGIAPVDLNEPSVKHINAQTIVEAGALGVAAGKITTFAATAGGGTQLCAITLGDEKLHVAHYYTGPKEATITSFQTTSEDNCYFSFFATQQLGSYTPLLEIIRFFTDKGQDLEIHGLLRVPPAGKLYVQITGAGNKLASALIGGWIE